MSILINTVVITGTNGVYEYQMLCFGIFLLSLSIAALLRVLKLGSSK